MSNYNKIGRIDRRRPIRAQWIYGEDQIAKVYSGQSVYDHAKLETEAIASAYENLDEADRAVIGGFVKKFDLRNHNSDNCVSIKGFGKGAILETCAKLGIFLNAVGE